MRSRGRALGRRAPVTAARSGQAKAPQSCRPEPGVTANLFEWNWPSVANECTTVLGPAGYGGVQVAPPQDSVKRQHLGDGSDTVLHPWWEVYQPVDYNLTSRMGTEAQFKAMVKTCRKAGVKVYVDAVINHMTGQGDTVLRRRRLHASTATHGGLRPGQLPSATPRLPDRPGRRHRQPEGCDRRLQRPRRSATASWSGSADLKTETT